ncbi:hypothetical protein HUU05_19745 [candidate division KSB1 bacterium]|nr:hypothetical protein [candidate division KSB1 bacterium]
MAHRAFTKFLIYSQDGLGLGHLRRNVNICYQIKKRCPQASCLIIADSPVAPFFRLPPHCDFIKIPTLVKVDTGIWRSDRLHMNDRELLGIRSEIIRNVILSFRPEVFLVDHMPHGALGELVEPLHTFRKFCPGSKLILGLRDILGAPEVIRQQWQREGAFDAITAYYDAVHIYGSAEFFDAVNEYDFPQALRAKTHYCGYVCREATPGHAPAGMIKDDEKFVLITGGGGADAAYFMDRFIDAVQRLDSQKKLRAFIATGPFVHQEQCDLLARKSRGLPIQVGRMAGDSIRFLRRADLVISMAGYNTVSEIMCFRKNAIVVPRAGPSAEQTMRTRIMSGRGLFGSIHPHDLTADNLAELIVQKLANGSSMNETMLPPLAGASQVASLLLTT